VKKKKKKKEEEEEEESFRSNCGKKRTFKQTLRS
jgi:hypothetical protein